MLHALATFERVIDMEDTDPKAWLNKGMVLSRLKQREKAIIAFDKAIALNPTYHEAWVNRGWPTAFCSRRKRHSSPLIRR